ncbi:conserved protein of unknown function [Pseudomonas sp. JV551A1]|uniref:Uncharacterized protein n=1 Tax=Pseudomonas inefficax TaxID=2078786 RepID=A0AAQ1P589_9PSED|nr:conserved protein of unknown function [Pseudomonas sp. JV551A1]SPO58735.1 conserved protein of unknown function [Pseudomonas inefficax]
MAQMRGKLGVGGFPGQLQAGEGAGLPQLLVLDQELVEVLEVGAQVGAVEVVGHGKDVWWF